jgi:hypothetical protein
MFNLILHPLTKEVNREKKFFAYQYKTLKIFGASEGLRPPYLTSRAAEKGEAI